MFQKQLLKLNPFLLLLLFCVSTIGYSQVGIGTTAPRGAVDIASTTQGFVLPEVSLASTTTQTAINPQGGVIPAGTIIYNDTTAGAGTTAVSPGMYYWNGGLWISITSDDWKEKGNTGTNPATDFLGTTDNVGIRFRTNNTERLEITNDGRFMATVAGSAANPLFAWSGDTDKGFYSPAADEFGLVTNGAERAKVTNSEAVFNNPENDVDFRIATNNEANTLFLEGSTDRIGIKTNSPQVDFHIAGATTGIRIDALSSTNNAANNGVDDSVIYVDATGNVKIKPSLTESQMPEDNVTTFVPTSVNIGDSNGDFTQLTLFSSTFTITRDALVEIVYQIGVNMQTNEPSPNHVIDDGYPRQYGTAVLVNGSIVGYTAEAFTARGDSTGITYASGTFFLNGNGYVELTGVPIGTTYTVSVIGFTYGGGSTSNTGSSTMGTFGGNAGLDRFQIITHY